MADPDPSSLHAWGTHCGLVESQARVQRRGRDPGRRAVLQYGGVAARGDLRRAALEEAGCALASGGGNRNCVLDTSRARAAAVLGGGHLPPVAEEGKEVLD